MEETDPKMWGWSEENVFGLKTTGDVGGDGDGDGVYYLNPITITIEYKDYLYHLYCRRKNEVLRDIQLEEIKAELRRFFYLETPLEILRMHKCVIIFDGKFNLFRTSDLFPTEKPEQFYPDTSDGINDDIYSWQVLNSPVEYKVIQILVLMKKFENGKSKSLQFYLGFLYWFSLLENDFSEEDVKSMFMNYQKSFFKDVCSSLVDMYVQNVGNKKSNSEKHESLYSYVFHQINCLCIGKPLPLSMILSQMTGVLFDDSKFLKGYSCIRNTVTKYFDSEHVSWEEEEKKQIIHDLELSLNGREEEAKNLVKYLSGTDTSLTYEKEFNEAFKFGAMFLGSSTKILRTGDIVNMLAAKVGMLTIIVGGNLKELSCGEYLYKLIKIIGKIDKDSGLIATCKVEIPTDNTYTIDKLDELADLYKKVIANEIDDQIEVKGKGNDHGIVKYLIELILGGEVMPEFGSNLAIYFKGIPPFFFLEESRNYLKARLGHINEPGEPAHLKNVLKPLLKLRKIEIENIIPSQTGDDLIGKLYMKTYGEILNIFSNKNMLKEDPTQLIEYINNAMNVAEIESVRTVKFNIFISESIILKVLNYDYKIGIKDALVMVVSREFSVSGKFAVESELDQPLCYRFSLISQSLDVVPMLWEKDTIRMIYDQYIVCLEFKSKDHMIYSDTIKQVGSKIDEYLKIIAYDKSKNNLENKKNFYRGYLAAYNGSNEYDPRLTILFLYDTRNKNSNDFDILCGLENKYFISEARITIVERIKTIRVSNIFNFKQTALKLLKSEEERKKINLETLFNIGKSYALTRGAGEKHFAEKMIDVLTIDDFEKEIYEVKKHEDEKMRVIILKKEWEDWFRKLKRSYRIIRNKMDTRYGKELFKRADSAIKKGGDVVNMVSDYRNGMLLLSRVKMVHQQDLMSVRNLPTIASSMTTLTYLSNLVKCVGTIDDNAIRLDSSTVNKFMVSYKSLENWQYSLEYNERYIKDFCTILKDLIMIGVSVVVGILTFGLSIIIQGAINIIKVAVDKILDYTLNHQLTATSEKQSLFGSVTPIVSSVLTTAFIGCYLNVEFNKKGKKKTDEAYLDHGFKVSAVYALDGVLKTIAKDDQPTEINPKNEEQIDEQIKELLESTLGRLVEMERDGLSDTIGDEQLIKNVCKGLKRQGDGFNVDEIEEKMKLLMKA